MTDEQKAIVNCIAPNGALVRIQAFAGTGKTSTAVWLTQRIRERQPGATILYLTFSKSLAEEAKKKFGGSVIVRTLHSLSKCQVYLGEQIHPLPSKDELVQMFSLEQEVDPGWDGEAAPRTERGDQRGPARGGPGMPPQGQVTSGSSSEGDAPSPSAAAAPSGPAAPHGLSGAANASAGAVGRPSGNPGSGGGGDSEEETQERKKNARELMSHRFADYILKWYDRFLQSADLPPPRESDQSVSTSWLSEWKEILWRTEPFWLKEKKEYRFRQGRRPADLAEYVVRLWHQRRRFWGRFPDEPRHPTLFHDEYQKVYQIGNWGTGRPWKRGGINAERKPTPSAHDCPHCGQKVWMYPEFGFCESCEVFGRNHKYTYGWFWDYVIVDECQDMSRCQIDLLLPTQVPQKIPFQTMPTTFVLGDRYQRIFGFRGAIPLFFDVNLTNPETLPRPAEVLRRDKSITRREGIWYPGKHFHLTRSFRFGKHIARWATYVLRFIGEPVPVVGAGRYPGVVEDGMDDGVRERRRREGNCEGDGVVSERRGERQLPTLLKRTKELMREGGGWQGIHS
uniref:UvrD-like helicase ATP-binding domain-containing protein n=1 Tax=Chromera velia CCMP2878 TaxID=1169474 RepID=A0A0G4I8S6_9ALVE|eukprot:Cvel_12027.t1-p1 / transcript=Cvel_12027.t1 / gene=Cvel_12027 / organism=Chromera_velia_CCMP2878 / gene_product=F-box only protein 18, putative / transcript_product=F-box only protein 18, putative / location=Cvel_scaffold772:25373-27551(-) / protein_length=564 / sequence_SO=supercontig / SO=protein_coding / is_pseudo=false